MGLNSIACGMQRRISVRNLGPARICATKARSPEKRAAHMQVVLRRVCAVGHVDRARILEAYVGMYIGGLQYAL